MPLSEETGGGNSLPPPVTLTKKEAAMGKVKLIVHECFTGKQTPEAVFTAVFQSNAAALTENVESGIMKTKEYLMNHFNISAYYINYGIIFQKNKYHLMIL